MFSVLNDFELLN